MPLYFRNHSSVALSIYTKTFMERPSDLLAHIQVCRKYKHHVTMKFSKGIILKAIQLFIIKVISSLLIKASPAMKKQKWY